jgi:uncharacterized membrane protein YGL010W
MNASSLPPSCRQSVQDWFSLYAESHRNPFNKQIHQVCVPLIYLVVFGLVWSLPVPWQNVSGYLNWATLAAIPVILFYLRLSLSLGLGMAVYTLMCLALIAAYEHSAIAPLRTSCAGLFILLWIGQFIGHHIEGKKPSFLNDIQFLLIGPLWLLGFVYQRLGWKI